MGKLLVVAAVMLPRFRAGPTVERVVQNEQWFEPYRQDALRAIGR